MKTISGIIDQRLKEIEQVLKNLPRVPNVFRHERFTWTVLHQLRGDSFQDLAANWNISAATVKNEVLKLKKSIGISLRKGRTRRD